MKLNQDEAKVLREVVAAIPQVADVIASFPPEHKVGALEAAEGGYVRAMLESPALFYIHEEGEAQPGLPAGLLGVAPFEVATRLSYLLWDSMPDSELFAAAQQSGVHTALDTNGYLGDRLSDEDLARIDCPVLVVIGDKDAAYPADRLVAAILDLDQALVEIE